MKVAGKHYRSIWTDADKESVHVIDQARLPYVFETLRLDTVEAVADAVNDTSGRSNHVAGAASTLAGRDDFIATSREPRPVSG